MEIEGINHTRRVKDLAGNPADIAAMSFTHLAAERQVLIARQAASESLSVAASAYGVTTLFQGRTWHGDLGMYYYRARWYVPEGGVFGERDPLGEGSVSNSFGFLNDNPWGYMDPMGTKDNPWSKARLRWVESLDDSFSHHGFLAQGEIAFIRRHHRASTRPLQPIRSLAYFRTVVLNLTPEETQTVYVDYIEHLYEKLQQETNHINGGRSDGLLNGSIPNAAP